MSNASSEALRLFIERIETLEEEKAGIVADIRDVYAEAKGQGFDTKTMRAIVKLRKMDANTRREAEALLDTYKAALGMLDGTPLGKWAVEKLTKARQPAEEDEPDAPDDAGDDAAPAKPTEPAAPEPTVEDAVAMGREAARSGKPVTANPFPPRDPRRAAWDEAWCGEIGSDGMDIPDALKPTPKPKKQPETTGNADEDDDQ